MFCTKCGSQLSDDAKFCPSCGSQVAPKRPSNNQQNYNAPNYNQQNYNAPNYNQQNYNTPDYNTPNYNTPNYSIPNENMRNNNSQRNASNGSRNNSGYTDNANRNYSNKSNNEKMDIIERYAPIAAFAPLAMMLLIRVLGRILFTVLGSFSAGYVICRIVIVLLKIIFVAATVGATGGLVYVAVKNKNMSNINTWVAPVTILLAAISCIGIAFRWGAFAWITGIIAFVVGLELLARIVIDNQPMDSTINPGGAFSTYKQYYSDYRAKYPTTRDLEKAGIEDPENSKFDGTGLELLGYTLLTILLCAITCGFAAPWMICKIYRWRVDHTVINGKRLTFTGTGGSLLGHWILWEILTVITCGIYGFFVYVAVRKWELKHTYIEGEPIVANGNESYFDGGSLGFLGYSLLSGLILTLTCSLAYPWVMSMLKKWDTKHQVINNRRLKFSGSGLGFLGEFLIIFILTFITCGIYTPWGTVRMNKYVVRHTDFVN